MCQFKSAVVLRDRIVCPLNKDSHGEILEDIGIDDDYLNATKTFVRVEMVPTDGDIFNHNPDNWVLKLDQDIVPDWFDKDKSEKEMREVHMPEVFSKCFIIDNQECTEHRDTRLFVKNSKVKTFNSSVEAWGNSSVVAWENSSVVARGNSSVEAWGNSSVVAWENSSVVAWENSSVVAMENSSVVAMENSSVVARGNSSVVARGNSSVVAMENSSVVARGNSQILIPKSFFGSNVNIKDIQENASVKDLSGDKPKIIVANKDIKIVKFKPNKK